MVRKSLKYLNKMFSKILFNKLNNLKVKLLVTKLIAGSQNARKIANNLKRATNDNISNNNLKIYTWNKSNSNISDKMGAIRNIIAKEKPSIMFVQELNLNVFQLANIARIEGYRFETDNLMEEYDVSRLGCWVSRDLVYERVKSLEDNRNPLIALNVGYPKTKRTKVIGYYRQFQSLDRKEEKNNEKELSEFTKVCNKISKILDNNEECIMAGDFNIDFRAVNLKDHDKSQYQKSQNKLMEVLKVNLLEKGMTILNNKPTFT